MELTVHSMFKKKTVDKNTRISLGVGVVLQDNKRNILLEKRRDCGLWGLPGGKLEPGETIVQTAVREIYEETGYHVEVVGLLGVYSDPEVRIITYPDNGDVVHSIDVIVEAHIKSGALRISDESEDIRFFNLNALPDEIVPPARAPIDDFLAKHKAVIR